MSIRAQRFNTDTPAPWAEPVPEAGPVTVDELLTRPDDGWRYEVVEGVLTRVAGSGAWATTIGRRIAARLGDHVDQRGLGLVTGADGVYRFPGAETGLIPDVGFLAAVHAAQITDLSKPIPFPPDLAVEVASPSQNRSDMAAKAGYYLDAGTALVWIVWPERMEVDVWHAGATEPSRVLGPGDTLDGEDIVPGFRCPIEPLLRKPAFKRP